MKMIKTLRTGLGLVGGLLLVAVLFTACKKDNEDFNNTPIAAIMSFNLAPDKNAVGFAISGNNLTNAPLNYTSYTGQYQTIFPGSREIAAYDFGSGTPFATKTINFEADKYYSVFAIGNNGTYQNIVVEDNLDSLSATAGQAYFRYINAIPDSANPAVTITVGGTPVSDNMADFGEVSDFTAITPGQVTINVADDSGIATNRTITMEANKVYTILLIGVKDATDQEKQVQVKFITNGTVT